MPELPFYGVTTTGIYCRTGCKSRKPLEKNVRRFATARAAYLSGFRACKRCRPDEPEALEPAIVEACRILDAAEARVTLGELGKRVGMSPGHLQRRFTASIGLSPRAYAERARAKGDLPRGGGKGSAIQYALVDSALGTLLIAATKRGICRVDIDANARALERRLRDAFPKATLERADGALDTATSRIVAYLAREGPWPLLPIDVRATAFQLRVWDALRAIPSGRTMGYEELACAIGSPGAARAVARACASNPVALLVPCHRILLANGSTGGYRWGPQRKRALLDIEQRST
jgi:AraC family transcriptional regulator, regulatory protein of adaptative response / methylated-DNA-[protein]-cysteine methyltransferase